MVRAEPGGSEILDYGVQDPLVVEIEPGSLDQLLPLVARQRPDEGDDVGSRQDLDVPVDLPGGYTAYRRLGLLDGRSARE